MRGRTRYVAVGFIGVVASLSGAASMRSVRPSAWLAANEAPRAYESDDIRIVEGRPQLSGRRSVAIDIDGDGDLDVIASSRDALVAVWINDGQDHFTRVVPAAAPAGLGDGAPAFQDQPEATLFAPPPTPKRLAMVVSARAPRPPDVHASVRPSRGFRRVLRRDFGATLARAPPASSARH
jgi:hypothetical protein